MSSGNLPPGNNPPRHLIIKGVIAALEAGQPGKALSLPARKFVPDAIGYLLATLCPQYQAEPYSSQGLPGLLEGFEKVLSQLLTPFVAHMQRSVPQIVTEIIQELPTLQRLVVSDARAIFEGDPAAGSFDEVILCYPGIYAIASYRLAHELHARSVPIVPRLLTEHAHTRTGIDIHPGAIIGERFCIDHGTGIVIGETAQLGANVKLYQGVTLGALSVSKGLAKKKRHPTLEDGVIVYSSATILGGETIVGRDSIIGGNVWLTKSVPPQSVVYHRSETYVQPHSRPEADSIDEFDPFI